MILKIKELIAEVIEKDVSVIEDDAHLYNDLDVDSLLGLEILVRVEEVFEVDIPEESLGQMTTPQSIANLLNGILQVS